MRKVFAVLTLMIFFYSPSSAQVLVDASDPRILFDPKNHDVGKIPGVIAIIDNMQKAIDTQQGDIDRNINDLINLQVQLRGLSFSTKNDATFPAMLLEAFRKAANDDDKIKVIREARGALERLLPALRTFDNDYSKFKQIFPSTISSRRVSSTNSAFLSDVLARLSRQIDDLPQGCNLADILKVIDKNLDDSKTFKDVELEDKADFFSTFQQCAETKRPDLSQVRSSMIADLEVQIAEQKTKADHLRTTRNTLLDIRGKWENQFRRATEISKSLIDWTIPLLALSVVAMLAIPAFYRLEVQQLVLSNGIILEVFTVFLLITTVLLLGIADRIQSEALGTLLGGISGYVLGRSALRTKADAENDQSRRQENRPTPQQEPRPVPQQETKPQPQP
jgi:hypothetical protein